MYYFDIGIDNTFDLNKTMECGQCFHYIKCEENKYIVFGANCTCEVMQFSDILRIWCDSDKEEYWKDYFDFNADYSEIIMSLREHCIENNDLFGMKSIENGMGIHILNQPYFETACSFILSQQNNIPRIQKMVFGISEKYGREKVEYEGREYFCFPWRRDLSAATIEELEKLGLGYRAKYLNKFVENWPNIIDRVKFDYCSDFELFKSCYGIGDKVSNCICLYGLHETDAFPIDVWMKRILKEEYTDKGLTFIMPKENAGILQQFMFYTKRNLRI